MVFLRVKDLEPLTSRLDSQMNEVVPLLFACLKLDMHLAKFDQGAVFTALDSFLKYDERCSILQPQSFHTVLLIARLYTQDSLKYKAQADYWLRYLAKLAVGIDNA